MKQTLAIPGILSSIPFVIHYDIDRFIDEILLKGEYDESIKALKGDHLKVMDLGCNIGTFSLSIYDRSDIIYAVDMIPNCIKLLQETIKENHLKNIVPIIQAIAGENKDVKVTSLESTDGGPTIFGNKDTIHAITLASLFKFANIDTIDLLKIDVEGAEYEIFEAGDFKDIKDKIGMIVGECHRGNAPDLERYGYIVTVKAPHFTAINPNYANTRTTN